MPSLTLAIAQQMIAGALAGERSSAGRHIAVAVCDAGAHPLALAREDLAPPLLAHIAQAKAFTCVAYGKPTELVRDWAEATPAWFEGVTNVAQATMGMPLIGSRGGVTVVDANGTVLGAVGIAGEAGEYDEALARRGIESAGLIAVSS
jgi:glc operon protein GlcG